jgi:hypothetical protein
MPPPHTALEQRDTQCNHCIDAEQRQRDRLRAAPIQHRESDRQDNDIPDQEHVNRPKQVADERLLRQHRQQRPEICDAACAAAEVIDSSGEDCAQCGHDTGVRYHREHLLERRLATHRRIEDREEETRDD